eukprot:COSAG01_NODE_3373_length_6178_cov_26.797171_4_plen_258_part_00
MCNGRSGERSAQEPTHLGGSEGRDRLDREGPGARLACPRAAAHARRQPRVSGEPRPGPAQQRLRGRRTRPCRATDADTQRCRGNGQCAPANCSRTTPAPVVPVGPGVSNSTRTATPVRPQHGSTVAASHSQPCSALQGPTHTRRATPSNYTGLPRRHAPGQPKAGWHAPRTSNGVGGSVRAAAAVAPALLCHLERNTHVIWLVEHRADLADVRRPLCGEECVQPVGGTGRHGLRWRGAELARVTTVALEEMLFFRFT